MMIEIDNIIEHLEKFAPLELAQSWDNSGWQINLGNKYTKKILLCLSLTPKIFTQAIENGCDLIVSHHPLIFSPVKNIEYNTITQKLLVDCIRNNIQVYCAHTNLDSTEGGVNDVLCEKLGLTPIETIQNFVKIAQLPEKMSLDSFILKLKISLNASKIKIINPNNIQEISRIALCAGSGGDFINAIDNVDLFITGDIKYHTALEVQNMIVIDAGHFETEKIILQTLKNLLQEVSTDIIIAKEVEPWTIV